MTWNMHDTVRGAITTLNADIAGAVYLSQGRKNVRGILSPQFTVVDAALQVQAQPHDPYRHQNALEYTDTYYTIYAYGNFSDLQRPDGRGGDVVHFARSPQVAASWYYIDKVLEWWPAWCCFEVVRQLNAKDIEELIAAIRNGENPTC